MTRRAMRRRSPKAAREKVQAARAKPCRKQISFPCMVWSQNGTKLIMFSASAKALWGIVDVNRKVEDKDEGYQRALSASRVAGIARFIDGGNILPTSVLVSFDSGTLSRDQSVLTLPDRPDAGWIIDGQHRLAGAHEADRDIILPVVAFVGLSEQEQINCFVTINREQKGVPSSLYYELLKHLPGAKTEKMLVQERAADIANALKGDEESPFYLRIVSTTAPRKGQLSLTNIVRKLTPLIRPGGRLSMYSDEHRQKIVNNMYHAIAIVFEREHKKTNTVFFRTLGFGALMNALPSVLDIALQHQHGFTVADATETFRRVDDFDFSGWHQMGSGTAAEKAAANDLVAALNKAIANTGDAAIRL